MSARDPEDSRPDDDFRRIIDGNDWDNVPRDDEGITHPLRKGGVVVESHSDTNWGGDRPTRRSTTSHVRTLHDVPVDPGHPQKADLLTKTLGRVKFIANARALGVSQPRKPRA